MHDYDRTQREAATNGKESTRLRAIASELRQIEDRLRALADEIPLRAEYAKRLPREFRGLYDAKKALKDLETAAVKVSSVVGMVDSGAAVIETYDDPHV